MTVTWIGPELFVEHELRRPGDAVELPDDVVVALIQAGLVGVPVLAPQPLHTRRREASTRAGEESE